MGGGWRLFVRWLKIYTLLSLLYKLFFFNLPRTCVPFVSEETEILYNKTKTTYSGNLENTRTEFSPFVDVGT